MDADSRRALARRAVTAVAERHGIGIDHLEIIKDANNTVVGVDASAVAKVATSQRPEPDVGLRRELSVLRHLAGRSAPVVRLSSLVPAELHEALGCSMLWLERVIEEPAEVNAHDALTVLSATHDALADFPPGQLPTFLDSLDAAITIFDDDVLSPALPTDERAFCRRVADLLAGRFGRRDWVDIVLHGDPWSGGNMIVTSNGVRLLDFEAVCIGPREWDLSSIGDLVDEDARVDHDLLDWCRLLRSYTVAAWCWSQPHRAPEVADAARWHLHLLHRRFS